jgi:hypothetical protein
MPGWLQAFVVVSLLGFIVLSVVYAKVARTHQRLAGFWQRQSLSNAAQVARMREQLEQAAQDRGL